ncbi:nucleolysin TIA-1/TIAR [Tremella mesenterica]|uniref:Nucleolysin TIA-1/TIAR n=1 Tax=Tremella mesenterica TaxID=5217 RepID=A0A4Q1BVL5_TREME|nr:nucleolysin TIA-1/TIAR [Tremella mesenterica]
MTSTQPYSTFGLTPGNHAEAPKKPHLYVGNLSPRVTDYMLTEIFAVAGPVVNAKIIQDRNFQHGGFNYGFVEYIDMRSAEQAIQTLNGRKIFDAEVKVNWAYQGQQNKEDTQHHHHVFVGDLSPEVNDDVLAKAFGAFGSMSEARVMWDMNSGKSRGYGFLSFRKREDAEQAINTMNGEWLGSRAIRVNWANQKTQTGSSGGMASMGTNRSASGGPPPMPPSSYTAPVGGVTPMAQPYRPPPQPAYSSPSYTAPSYGHYPQLTSSPTPAAPIAPVIPGVPPAGGVPAASATPVIPDNCTLFVGNLGPYVTQAELTPLFQTYGYVTDIRMQADRGYAFVKLDTSQAAVSAMATLQNTMVQGRPLKIQWGREKPAEAAQAGWGQSQYPQVDYSQYGYYGGYAYGQQGAQQQGWDQYYGQGGQGWGGYYNQDGTQPAQTQ